MTSNKWLQLPNDITLSIRQLQFADRVKKFEKLYIKMPRVLPFFQGSLNAAVYLRLPACQQGFPKCYNISWYEQYSVVLWACPSSWRWERYDLDEVDNSYVCTDSQPGTVKA